MAALLASLPRTTSSASSTCHCRSIPFLEGNSVLIDTRLHFFSYKLFSLTGMRPYVKWGQGIRTCTRDLGTAEDYLACSRECRPPQSSSPPAFTHSRLNPSETEPVKPAPARWNVAAPH